MEGDDMTEKVLYHNGAEIHVFRPKISDAEREKRLHLVKVAMMNMGKELAEKEMGEQAYGNKHVDSQSDCRLRQT